MKLMKKIKKASMSKKKKDKKGLAKKIDKKILKALKERYLKAKREKKEAKSAYDLAKSFFNKNSKKSKSTKKNSKNKIAEKPKSNAKLTTFSELEPTPSKVAKKLPKTLRVKRNKPTTKIPTTKPTVTKKEVVQPKTAKITKPVVKKQVNKPKSTPNPTISKRQMEDLKVVEGVGPAIERLLKTAGIKTLEMLSKAKVAELRKVLADAGNRFRFHKPDTWARQARLAAAGRWKELDELQKKLDGGKKK